MAVRMIPSGNNLFSGFVELVFPKICFNCRKRIENNILCRKCSENLVFLENVCEFCGSPLKNESCQVCQTEDFFFDKARSVFPFNKVVQNLIHDLKYDEMIKVAEMFGKKAAEYIIQFKPFAKIDIIAPVPLHSVKKRHRGFNQSEILSRHLADQLQIEHYPHLIKRFRFTKTQTKLTKSERQKNVNNAFRLDSGIDIYGKSILILDDVFTTGSTLNAISKLFKEHKTGSIYAFTIARA